MAGSICSFIVGRDPLEYANVNKVQFESAIRDLLLVHLYRVEVYDTKSWKIAYKVLSCS